METVPVAAISVSTNSVAGIVVLGTAGSIIAAVLGGAVVRLWRRWRERHGHLAGWWWQITYPPQKG
jgi:hypothetical protein